MDSLGNNSSQILDYKMNSDKLLTQAEHEQEMALMKTELDVNFRLSNIERTCDDINNSVLKHIAMEAKDSSEIKQMVEEASMERRKCEADLRKDIAENSKSYYKEFVKKSDLKLYAFLIIFTITAVASIQAWVINQNYPSSELLQKIEKKLG